MRAKRGRSRRDTLAVLAVGATLALGGAGVALAATTPDASTGPDEPAADVPVLDHDSQFERSLGVGVARVRYEKLYEQAKRLDVEPKRGVAIGAGKDDIADASDGLRKRIEAERERRKEAAKPDYGTPESVGVDQSTLDSIAACESGGDPTAVDPSGTYRGKYQFDLQTWASVGGSGDPAAAPEAEQDYRAALLMSRSGSSPWPVCG
ncbi:MAG TPA: transglycosylase family protein [Solirubrobacterales bacterium]|nr:transglycosylase family protein [Solirubrobacterales bacterium]